MFIDIDCGLYMAKCKRYSVLYVSLLNLKCLESVQQNKTLSFSALKIKSIESLELYKTTAWLVSKCL